MVSIIKEEQLMRKESKTKKFIVQDELATLSTFLFSPPAGFSNLPCNNAANALENNFTKERIFSRILDVRYAQVVKHTIPAHLNCQSVSRFSTTILGVISQ